VTASITSLVQNDQRISAQERILTGQEWASNLMRGEQANQMEADGSYQLLRFAERERQVVEYNAGVARRKVERLAEIDRLNTELARLTASLPPTPDPSAAPPQRTPSEDRPSPTKEESNTGLYVGLAAAVIVAGGAAWLWHRSSAASSSPLSRRRNR
jgi:hypothetical protein